MALRGREVGQRGLQVVDIDEGRGNGRPVQADRAARIEASSSEDQEGRPASGGEMIGGEAQRHGRGGEVEGLQILVVVGGVTTLAEEDVERAVVDLDGSAVE